MTAACSLLHAHMTAACTHLLATLNAFLQLLIQPAAICDVGGFSTSTWWAPGLFLPFDSLTGGGNEPDQDPVKSKGATSGTDVWSWGTAPDRQSGSRAALCGSRQEMSWFD